MGMKSGYPNPDLNQILIGISGLPELSGYALSGFIIYDFN